MFYLVVALTVLCIHAVFIIASLPDDEEVTPGRVAVVVIFDIIIISLILLIMGASNGQ